MILYYFNPYSQRKVPCYFFRFGSLIEERILGAEVPEEDSTPLLKDFQNIVTEAATEQISFLERLMPFSSAVLPLPVYSLTDEGDAANRTILLEFLVQYLFPKYWFLYVYPCGDSESDSAKVYKSFFNRFSQLIIATWGKYAPIVKAFKEKEGQLLARLGSESTSLTRFNDTPQNSGDFKDEAHTTTATQSANVTASDYETPINRLREIREKFENVYNAWARDFDILFTRGAEREL